jgi:putative glycosyltransferase (TIGR04372 family)
MVPLVYERPLLFVNALPLSHFGSFSNAIWVPKPLRWRDGGQPLSVQEHLQSNFFESSKYHSAGIDVVDMTSSAIILAVQEFWQRCAGTWENEPEDELRQQEFWDTCMAWPEFSRYHEWRHGAARVGTAWLRSLEVVATR